MKASETKSTVDNINNNGKSLYDGFTGKTTERAESGTAKVAAEIEKEINNIIQNQPDKHLLLNLKEVEYMSSSGLRIFVSTMRILKESKRKLKLCNMNSAVKKIFEVVELNCFLILHKKHLKLG